MSDTLRRRIAALLLVAGIAVAVLAIKDVGPFSDPPTAEQNARAAVERFFEAAAKGDSKTFCRLLTDDARTALEVNTAQRLETNDVPTCTQILDILAPAFAGSKIDVRFVSVSGNRARVEARYKIGDEAAQPRTVLLLLVNGEWRISDPG